MLASTVRAQDEPTGPTGPTPLDTAAVDLGKARRQARGSGWPAQRTEALGSQTAGATVLAPDIKQYDNLPRLLDLLQDSGADFQPGREPYPLHR